MAAIKRCWAPVLYLALAIAFVVMGIYQVGKPPERLSEEEIAALREEYPVYPVAFPPDVCGRYPDLEGLIIDVDCFIYGEIIGDADTYSNYRYTLRVIRDTEGIYEPGEELTLPIGTRYITYRELKPEFQVGMKIVYGTIASQKNPKETGYAAIGTYYVTDGGYVLSAFPEDEKNMKTRPPYTGVKVEYLLKQLKKSSVVRK